jgi:hypothetical protein
VVTSKCGESTVWRGNKGKWCFTQHCHHQDLFHTVTHLRHSPIAMPNSDVQIPLWKQQEPERPSPFPPHPWAASSRWHEPLNECLISGGQVILTEHSSVRRSPDAHRHWRLIFTNTGWRGKKRTQVNVASDYHFFQKALKSQKCKRWTWDRETNPEIPSSYLGASRRHFSWQQVGLPSPGQKEKTPLKDVDLAQCTGMNLTDNVSSDHSVPLKTQLHSFSKYYFML